MSGGCTFCTARHTCERPLRQQPALHHNTVFLYWRAPSFGRREGGGGTARRVSGRPLSRPPALGPGALCRREAPVRDAKQSGHERVTRWSRWRHEMVTRGHEVVTRWTRGKLLTMPTMSSGKNVTPKYHRTGYTETRFDPSLHGISGGIRPFSSI